MSRSKLSGRRLRHTYYTTNLRPRTYGGQGSRTLVADGPLDRVSSGVQYPLEIPSKRCMRRNHPNEPHTGFFVITRTALKESKMSPDNVRGQSSLS